MPRPATKYKPVNAYIPISCPSMSELVEGTSLHEDSMRALFHQFYLQRLRVLSFPEEKRNYLFEYGWVNLSGSKLNRIVGRGYRAYISQLEKLNVAEVFRGEDGRKKYAKNGYSQLYRIRSEYLHKTGSPNHFRKEQIKSYVPLKKIYLEKAAARLLHSTRNSMNPDRMKLIEMLDRFHLDAEGVREYVDKMYRGETESLVSIEGNPIALGDLILLADAINSREYEWYVSDEFGERFHTPYTSLFKEVRKYLKIAGDAEPVKSLDISNSQPYFSSIAIHPSVVMKFLPEFSECVPVLSALKCKPDFIKYSELCSQGKLYLYWAELRQFQGTSDEKKNQAKPEIFKLLYRKNGKARGRLKPEQVEFNCAIDLFKRHFPNVFHAFGLIKKMTESQFPFINNLRSYQDKSGRFTTKNYHKNLSCMMQRLEARIFLGQIVPALLEQDIYPFLTIHDSVIVPERFAVKAKTIILEEFTKLDVMPPHLPDE